MTDQEADVPGLARWVKSHSAADELSLPHARAKALLDEIKRLTQSSELLRKQNKKLRARAAGLAPADGSGDMPEV